MLRRAGIAVLFALLCRETARRGPLTLHAPATVFSNGVPTLKAAADPYLLFLRWVSWRVPGGASVAVLTNETPSLGLSYLIAVGQLPEREVWPLATMGGGDAPVHAEWVAAYFTIFDDPRYRQVDSVPNGWLFRRIR